MSANAPFGPFDLPPLDRPRARGLGEFAARLRRLASLAAEVGAAFRPVRTEPEEEGPVARRAAGVTQPAPLMGGEAEWSRATERLTVGARRANDANLFHASATDQLDAAAYELGILLKELGPVVAAGMPVPATADVVRIEAPQPAIAPAAAPASVPAEVAAKRAKPRKKKLRAVAAA